MSIARVAAIIGKSRTAIVAPTTAWKPSDEASLRGWWDMQAPELFSSNARWTARYGGQILIPAGGSAGVGPTRIANGLEGNNKNCLIFSGTQRSGLSWANPNLSQCICVMVYRYTSVASGVNPVVWYRTAYGLGTQGMQNYDWGGGFGLTQRGRAVTDYGPSYLQTRIVIGLHSDARIMFRLDGTERLNSAVSSTGTEVPASSELEIFGAWSGGPLNYTAQLACVAFFDASGWSNLLAQKIEGFICHQGIGGMTAAKLPAEHPYKNEFPS